MVSCVALAMASTCVGETGRVWRVDLADGGRIVGEIAVEAIDIDTEFGRLRVPLSKVVEMTPGLACRPELERRIVALVEQLGDERIATREAAQKELSGLVVKAHCVLSDASRGENLERRQRAKRLLSGVEAKSTTPRIWPRHDTVLAGDQRISGRILTAKLDVAHRGGRLSVPLAAIESVAPPASARPVDLLKEIEAAEDDPRRNNWSREGAVVISPDSPRARIRVPVVPPGEYELRLAVKPESGREVRGRTIADSLFITVIVGGQQCNVALSAFADVEGGPFSGLDTIDGKRTHLAPLHRGSLFSLDKETSIVCRIGPESVDVRVDDKPLFHWEGNPQRLAVNESWRLDDANCLGIGTHRTVYRIRTFTMTPIEQPRRPTSVAAHEHRVRLVDGTLVAGRLAEAALLVVPSDADGTSAKPAPRRIALDEVRTLERDTERAATDERPVRWRAELASGEKVSVRWENASTELTTPFGKLAVPADSVVSLERGDVELNSKPADKPAAKGNGLGSDDKQIE